MNSRIVNQESSHLKKKSILNWADTVNDSDQKELDLLCGELFYKTGISFRIADTKAFKILLKSYVQHIKFHLLKKVPTTY